MATRKGQNRIIKVGAVQMISERYNPEANIVKALSFCERASRKNVQYLCFPECAVTGFDWIKDPGGPRKIHTEPVPGPTVRRFEDKSKLTGLYIIMGIVEKEGRDLYNTAFLVGPEEGYMGKYRKVFSEKVFKDGSEAHVFDTRFARIGIFICRDMRSPELSRLLVLKGAEILFQPTAYFHSDGIDIRRRYIGKCCSQRARSMENGVHVVAANIGRPEYVNNSRIIVPQTQGPEKVLARATRKEQLLTADIKLGEKKKSPVDRLRRAPWLYRELGQKFLELTE